jgi:hypothetical protein
MELLNLKTDIQNNNIMELKRVGNWYNVGEYNVVVVKETNTYFCDPSSILVFDEMFNRVEDPKVYEKIEKIMGKVDWKYDMVDED